MRNKKLEPPFTNRGVVNTLKDDKFAVDTGQNDYLLFDWIECTIFDSTINVFDIFRHVFNISRSDVLVKSGGKFGYDTTYYYKNIQIMFASYRLNEDLDNMGYHVYITGQGCRDIEDLALSYEYIFKKLFDYGATFTRVDVSMDIFSNRYLSFKKIENCVLNNEVRSKFRSSCVYKKVDLSKCSNLGHTIYFGSRSSNIMIVFYDKLKEREYANKIVNENIKFWLRLEVRFRDNYATEVVYNFLNQYNFNIYYKGILSNYLNFVNITSDSNRSRYPLKSWWSDFLNSVDKVRLTSVNVEQTITKKRNWLFNTVSKSNFMVFLSTLDLSVDKLSSDYLYNFLKEGLSKIEYKDLQFINDYRNKCSLQPYTYDDIFELVNDIKGVLLNIE